MWEKVPEGSPFGAENWALALPQEFLASLGYGDGLCFPEYNLAAKRDEDTVTPRDSQERQVWSCSGHAPLRGSGSQSTENLAFIIPGVRKSQVRAVLQ